jgi:hypothetical protein
MRRILAITTCLLLAGAVPASAEHKSRKVTKAELAEVCPADKITQIGSTFFYKNNKPIRASSAINAPVIGNNPVMTLAGQPGKGKGLFKRKATLLASDGSAITSMTPYPCRSDHCGGRVVSSMKTGVARKKAVRATGSAKGYVKLGGGLCVEIPDIGGCFGNGVDKGRPLCDRIVK